MFDPMLLYLPSIKKEKHFLRVPNGPGIKIDKWKSSIQELEMFESETSEKLICRPYGAIALNLEYFSKVNQFVKLFFCFVII